MIKSIKCLVATAILCCIMAASPLEAFVWSTYPSYDCGPWWKHSQVPGSFPNSVPAIGSLSYELRTKEGGILLEELKKDSDTFGDPFVSEEDSALHVRWEVDHNAPGTWTRISPSGQSGQYDATGPSGSVDLSQFSAITTGITIRFKWYARDTAKHNNQYHPGADDHSCKDSNYQCWDKQGEFTVDVNPCKDPPIELEPSANKNRVKPGEEVTITATAIDEDYNWAAQNPCETSLTTDNVTITSGGNEGVNTLTVKHTWSTPGVYTVTFTADDAGVLYNDPPVTKEVKIWVEAELCDDDDVDPCGDDSCSDGDGFDIDPRYGIGLPAPGDLGPGLPSGSCESKPGSFPGTMPTNASANGGFSGKVDGKCTTANSPVTQGGVVNPTMYWEPGSAGRAGKIFLPDDSAYEYDEAGRLVKKLGPAGNTALQYEYDEQAESRITDVVDAFGNTWTYEGDASTLAPTSVVFPGGRRAKSVDYVPDGEPGRFQFQRVREYLKDSTDQWILHKTIEYEYFSADGQDDDNWRLSKVTITDGEDTQNAEVTILSYYSTDQAGLVKPLQRVYTAKTSKDIRYSYGIESIGGHDYGFTETRQLAYANDAVSDLEDHIARTYYYRANGKNTYVFRMVQMAWNGTAVVPYSVDEYQIYGFLSRFPGSPQEASVLKGKTWKYINARGFETTYEYSEENANITRVNRPNNTYTQTWYMQVNSMDTNFVEKVRDAKGNYTRFVRDSNVPAWVTQVQVSDDDQSYTTIKLTDYYGQNSADPDVLTGRVKREIVPDIEGSDDLVTEFEYDEQVGQQTVYRPAPTRIKYQGRENGAYINAESISRYDSYSRLLSTVDAHGNTTEFEYDALNRVTRVLHPWNDTETGVVQSGQWTSSTITVAAASWEPGQLKGMLLQIEDVGEFEVSDNTATTITIAEGTIDAATGKAFYVRPYTQTTYAGCCGKVASERDERGFVKHYLYDEAGRLVQIRNSVTGSDPLVTYQYNDLGQTVASTSFSDDQSPRTTTYQYDQLGRQIQTTQPGSGLLFSKYYQYDVASNMVAQVEGIVDTNNRVVDGDVTRFEHDSLNRIVKLKREYAMNQLWPLTITPIQYPDETYAYMGDCSQISSMEDLTGLSEYEYDARGQLEEYTPGLTGHSVTYQYNNAGSKTLVQVQYGSTTFATEYLYYKNGQLKQITGKRNSVEQVRVNYDYNALGARVYRNNAAGNDLYTEYGYATTGEHLAVNHWNSSQKTTARYNISYVRDAGGIPIKAAFTGSNVPSVFQNNSVAYTHDIMGRITSQQVGGGTPTTWSYDWVGNRNPGTNSYNEVDQLNAGSGFTYDMKGALSYKPNSSADPREEYTYWPNDLLNTIRTGGTQGTYPTQMSWNAAEKRVELVKEDTFDIWQYVYDETVSDPIVLLEHTPSGSVFYIREPDGSLVASITDQSSPVVRYYHFDQLGSTVLLTDGTGTTQGAWAYDAWGQKLAEPSTYQTPYQYIGALGYYTHSAAQGPEIANLLQLGVRFYDPELGRFERRGSPYAYGGGAPLVWVQPSGGGYRFIRPGPGGTFSPIPRPVYNPRLPKNPPKSPPGGDRNAYCNWRAEKIYHECLTEKFNFCADLCNQVPPVPFITERGSGIPEMVDNPMPTTNYEGCGVCFPVCFSDPSIGDCAAARNKTRDECLKDGPEWRARNPLPRWEAR